MAYQEAAIVCRGREPPSREALVRALLKTTNLLQILGQHEEAHNHCQEIIVICRQLSNSTPPQAQEFFAEALRETASVLLILKRIGDACAAEQEATSICANLYKISRHEDSRSLFDLGWGRVDVWRAQGYVEEAYAIVRGMVAASERLWDTKRDPFCKLFISTLWRYSNFLHTLGRSKEALATCKRAVSRSRLLCQEMNGEYTEYFCTSLWNLAYYLHSMGQVEEAVVHLQECITLCRGACENSQHGNLDCYERLVESSEALHVVQSAAGTSSSVAALRLRVVVSDDRFESRTKGKLIFSLPSASFSLLKEVFQATTIGLEHYGMKQHSEHSPPAAQLNLARHNSMYYHLQVEYIRYSRTTLTLSI